MTTPTITKDEAAHRAAMSLLRNGHASPSEVAQLAGVSRQLVNYWAADIDWRKARSGRLAREWRNAIRG